MFKDLPEGTTHHDKDACYKCKICGDHFFIENQAVERCDHDYSIAKNFCEHVMVKKGKYERQCKFCGLIELTAGLPEKHNYKNNVEVGIDSKLK